MSTTILGISAFYHDSAAAIIRDGEIIAAAQEERFSRKKHDPRFPHHAINYCLEEAFIESSELDAVVFYDNPLFTWDRVLKNCMMAGPRSFDQFKKASRSVLGIKMWVKDYIIRSIGSLGKLDKLLFTEHHMSHAASAFYPSPFQKAAIITLDGVGEWATTTIGLGTDNRIELFQEINYPHSLGLLYSAFTYYCGFKVNSGEYKLMGLAPYGEPIYYDAIRENLIDIKEDGSYNLNTEYFGYLDSSVMTNDKFNNLFGGSPRKPESYITRREMDMAASIQKTLEEVILRMALHTKKETGADNLVMAGGVALNCVANGKVLKKGIFDDFWIQPAASDAGGAVGAALLVSHAYFDIPRKINPNGRDTQRGSYLGPAYKPSEVVAFLGRKGYPYERIANPQQLAEKIAQVIADGKIVGYFAGRMEFGPRALGARSILGDPRRRETQSVMNLKIKFRESFRPFAPSVLAEDVSEFFEMESESPYMLLVAPVRKERCLPMNLRKFQEGDDNMSAVITQSRSDIPAVTHVDYSARVQTVHPSDKPDYYHVIKKFKDLTGYGIIVNTSFNVRGEPIVCSPQDAYRCFMRTEMDLLVLEDCLLWKEEQPAFEDTEDWRKTYELD
ncbi:MAG: carbamoyltransferase [Dehalococcoidales bacterium]|nr:carbamoyltransferase [Dehalococcoidales bacterium]